MNYRAIALGGLLLVSLLGCNKVGFTKFPVVGETKPIVWDNITVTGQCLDIADFSLAIQNARNWEGENFEEFAARMQLWTTIDAYKSHFSPKKAAYITELGRKVYNIYPSMKTSPIFVKRDVFKRCLADPVEWIILYSPDLLEGSVSIDEID